MLLIDAINRYGLTPDRASGERTHDVYLPLLRNLTVPVIEMSNIADAWMKMKKAVKGEDPIDWLSVIFAPPAFSCFMEVSDTKSLNQYLPVTSPLLPFMPSAFGAIVDVVDMWENPGITNHAPDLNYGEYTRSNMAELLHGAHWKAKVVGDAEAYAPVTPVRWAMDLYLIAEFRTLDINRPIGPLGQMTVLIQPTGKLAVNEQNQPCIILHREDYTRDIDTSDYLEVFRDPRALTWLEPILFAQGLMHCENILSYNTQPYELDRARFVKKTGKEPTNWLSLGVAGHETIEIPGGTFKPTASGIVWAPAV